MKKEIRKGRLKGEWLLFSVNSDDALMVSKFKSRFGVEPEFCVVCEEFERIGFYVGPVPSELDELTQGKLL